MKRAALKKIHVIYIALALVFFAFSVSKIYAVNTAFPQTEKVVVEAGDTYTVAGNIMLQVKGASWLDRAQLEEKYGREMGLLQNFDYKAIVVEVVLKNTADVEQEFELYNLYLESETWYTNGIDMEMYMVDNEPMMKIELEAGEEKRLYLPYSMSDVQFTDEEWKTLREETFYLVKERYPVKVYWEVP